MTTAAPSKTIRSLIVGAALVATGAVAIGSPTPIASAGPAAGSTTCFDSGAPAGAGVVVNGTAAAPTGPGYLNFYQPGPNAEPDQNSSVNFDQGAAVANSVITPVGADSQICAFNSAEADIIADVSGWIAPARLLSFEDGKAVRVRDYRRGRKLRSTDAECFLAATDAVPGEATFLNITIAAPDGNGFANLYPKGGSPTANSVINYVAGRNVANGVTVAAGVDSEICIYVSADAWVIIDSIGAVAPANFRASNADGSADRVFNTRNTTPFGSDEERCFATEGAEGEAVVLNATAVAASANGYLNVYPSDATADPAANSSVNYRPGANVANGLVVPVGADGDVCIYSSLSTDVIIDVAGYLGAGTFIPLNADGSATRVLNTRES